MASTACAANGRDTARTDRREYILEMMLIVKQALEEENTNTRYGERTTATSSARMVQYLEGIGPHAEYAHWGEKCGSPCSPFSFTMAMCQIGPCQEAGVVTGFPYGALDPRRPALHRCMEAAALRTSFEWRSGLAKSRRDRTSVGLKPIPLRSIGSGLRLQPPVFVLQGVVIVKREGSGTSERVRPKEATLSPTRVTKRSPVNFRNIPALADSGRDLP